MEREQALEAGRLLHKCDAKMKRISAEFDAEIAILEADLEQLQNRKQEALVPLVDEANMYVSTLKAYHEANVANGGDKTDKMPFCTIKARKAPQSYRKDDEAVIEWLKQNNMSEFVKTKEQLDWSNMKKDVEVHDGKCFMYGVIVPVLEAEPETITYSVEVK